MSHIVIIGPAYPLRGGLATFDERLAREFQHQGDKVTIYTFSLQYPNFLFPGKTQYSDDPPPTDLDIKVVINSVNPFNWVKIGREIADLKPDMIVCRFWLPFMAPCCGTIHQFVKRNQHTKIVGLTDNIAPHEKRFGDNIFAKYFTKRFTKYFIDSCHAYMVMSRFVEENLRQFTDSQRIKYIEHPIYDTYGEKVSREIALSTLQLPTSELPTPQTRNLKSAIRNPQSAIGRYILFFGFIREYKGLDILLEAMAMENVRKTGVKLIVAGEFYEDATRYQSIISEKKIAESVVLHTDYIATEKVKYYFGAADLIVQPYKTATQSGISLVAYHFEKPMVVSNVGGLPEIVPHGKAGYVVEPNPQAVADAIADFYEKGRYDDFAATLAERKKEFSWAKVTETLRQL
jgi:D-inositol-3-phosphate glycosyltransferase